MTNPNDPAFLETFYDGEKITTGRGLTKREHFTALAMQGTLANPELIAHLDRKSQEVKIKSEHGVAQFSVHMADALIKELNK